MQALERIEQLTQEVCELQVGSGVTKTGDGPGKEQLDQLKKTYEGMLAVKDQEREKLIQQVDGFLADQEAQIETLRRKKEELTQRVEGVPQLDKERQELEQRVCELGVVTEKLRHKEGKMKNIIDQFKTQLLSQQ